MLRRTGHRVSRTRICAPTTLHLLAPPRDTTTAQRPVSTSQRRSFFSLNDLSKIAREVSPSGTADKPTIYRDSRVLRYAPRELYTIVSDVDSYSEFLPFCTSSRITGPASSTGEEPRSTDVAMHSTRRVLAELGVGFKSFKESYTSIVEMREDEWVRATALPHPLFKHLSTHWTFIPLEGSSDSPSTKIAFELEYAFTSPLYAAVAAGIFRELSSRMMQSFEDRAAQIYGERT
ncbi:unnamed protein product [Parajaminaea phylloscopi]